MRRCSKDTGVHGLASAGCGKLGRRTSGAVAPGTAGEPSPSLYMGTDPQRRELIGYTLRYQHLDLSPGNIEFAGEPSYAPRRLKP